jgi:Flp pilus assembly protein TadD
MALQLKPKEIQLHLNLGEVYALAGLREKALDKLDHALRLFGDDARLKQARIRCRTVAPCCCLSSAAHIS